jgi:KaiC/GvpD/RAD55 family RecA-like ATPase
MDVAASRLGGTPHCDHLVQVYARSVDLAEAAATFFAAGFEAGEPAVAIATAAHWPLIAERLARRGWAPDHLQADGRLRVRDAEVALESISDDEEPSAAKFRELVGGLLHEVARQDPRRRVRAFGEMVDVLVQRGDHRAADVLERYWNELAEQRNFTLLCGYKVDRFDPTAHSTLLPQIYRSHAQALALPDEDRFAGAVERALVEVLGESDARTVYARVSQNRGKAPESQLALMWLTAHMPRAAAQVLTLARDHYAGSAAA